MDELTSRIAITVGSTAGGWGISRKWWIGLIAGCLAWKYGQQATAVLSAFLAIAGGWYLLVSHAWRRRRQSEFDDGEIIDAEFEVKHGP